MHPKIVQGLTLYFSLFSAPCRTVLLTLKYLNIDLPPGGLKQINIHEKAENQDPWFEKINYEKVVPTIIDNGFILWESRVIAKYLAQKFAQPTSASLYPNDIQQQAYVDRLLYFDKSVLSQSIDNYFQPQFKYHQLPNPVLGAKMEHSLQLLGRLLLKSNKYILGGAGGKDQLSVADFSILATLSKLDSMDYSYGHHELISNYAEFLKDNLVFYRECCQEGVNLMKDWTRTNLKYLPAYLEQPGMPYDDNFYERRV